MPTRREGLKRETVNRTHPRGRGAGGAGAAQAAAPYIGGVLNPTALWREFEARDERETYADLTYEQALRRFAALWAYAREVNASIGEDWEEDIQADLAVARAINGLPPAA